MPLESKKLKKEVELVPGRYLHHPRDVEYFGDYRAPLMELMQSFHHTHVNATLAFFGPMFYFLVRSLGCEQVLEIGHAEGYSSRYLAHAVKDNATRFNMQGNMYYGIDIEQTEYVTEMLAKDDLPATIIQMDSMDLTSETFKDVRFDLIFQDGCHDTEHVLHELKVLYPQLKGKGTGFWIFHDCYGPAEEGFHELIKLIKEGVYDFEWCRLPAVYGLAILRKMEGYDYDKRFWV